MQQYITQRLLLMIPTLFGVALFIFLLMRVLPGDIVEIRYTSEGGFVSEETLASERARLGLDQPLPIQFVKWIYGLIGQPHVDGHFPFIHVHPPDLGVSMWTGRPITEEIAIRFQLSLQVAIMGTLFSIIIAIPLGTLAAMHQDTWIDYAVRVFSVGGLAIPSFWLGILIILFLLNTFNWIPPLVFTPLWEDPARNLSQLIWPTLAIGYSYSAIATRMTRSSILEILRDDYIRTARAKGQLERITVMRHVLPNAMLPVITVVGLEFAFLLGGLVVTEQVFNLNGIGKLFVEAINHRDYTMTQALVLLVAVTFIFVNFIVDLLYALFDPRIKYG